MDDFKKTFAFSFTEAAYDGTPELSRNLTLEMEDEATYSDVMDQFLFFLSGCWGYQIRLEDIIQKKYGVDVNDNHIDPLSSFPEALEGSEHEW